MGEHIYVSRRDFAAFCGRKPYARMSGAKSGNGSSLLPHAEPRSPTGVLASAG
jgi:hypothetical protein